VPSGPAGVLARAGAAGAARRVVAAVAADLAADPVAAREPFHSELWDVGASVQLRLAETDSAAALSRRYSGATPTGSTDCPAVAGVRRRQMPASDTRNKHVCWITKSVRAREWTMKSGGWLMRFGSREPGT
jgi:hypothetical protein